MRKGIRFYSSKLEKYFWYSIDRFLQLVWLEKLSSFEDIISVVDDTENGIV